MQQGSKSALAAHGGIDRPRCGNGDVGRAAGRGRSRGPERSSALALRYLPGDNKALAEATTPARSDSTRIIRLFSVSYRVLLKQNSRQTRRIPTQRAVGPVGGRGGPRRHPHYASNRRENPAAAGSEGWFRTSRWRRDRDSNPGDGFPPTHFPGVRLRPLGHLSVGRRHRETAATGQPRSAAGSGSPGCRRHAAGQ